MLIYCINKDFFHKNFSFMYDFSEISLNIICMQHNADKHSSCNLYVYILENITVYNNVSNTSDDVLEAAPSCYDYHIIKMTTQKSGVSICAHRPFEDMMLKSANC